MLNPIIVTTSELAQIFKCDTRTISKLATAGILERSDERGKYELLTSTANYIEHLRRVASGLTTAESKVAALTALTNLRDAQRDLIEKKSKDYVLVEDVKRLAAISGNIARTKLLELPRRLRQKIEDNHFALIASRTEAVSVEDDSKVCASKS